MENPVLMLGGLCLDRYCLLSQFPVKGQDTLIQDTFERIGGCPINAAFTLKKFGLDPVLYSAVGAESIEKVQAFFHRNELPADGLFVIEDQKTGFCMILLDDQKERTFMTYRGCEGIFDPARIPALNYRACCLTGSYLIYGTDSENAIAYLHTFGTDRELFFDPGPLCDQIDPDLLEKAMRLCTHLKVNEEEQRLLEQTLGRPLTAYFQYRMRAVVVTCGSRGAQLIQPEQTQSFPALPIKLADSNGAGDAFFAGYAASVLQGKPLAECMRIASACGALTAMTLGPHAEGGLKEILQLLQDA